MGALTETGRSLLYALGATAVLAGVVWLCLRVARFLLTRVESGEGTVERKLRSYGIRKAQRVRGALAVVIRLVRLLVILALLDLYLLAVFGLFPATEGLSTHMALLALEPLKGLGRALVAYLPKLFSLVIIVIFVRVLIGAARLVFDELQTGTLRVAGFHPEWAVPTYRIFLILIVGFGLVVSFPYLPGSGSEAFKAVSLFFGIIFSLASSSAVSNIISGILLLYTGAFHVGDRVRIGDTVGDVTARGLLVTRVQTIKNVEVSLPNSLVLGSAMENYSTLAATDGLILHTTVTIGYDAPWRTVHQLLIAAGLATEGVLAEPAPFVWQTSLNDSHVSYELNVFTREARRMPDITAALHASIQEKFNEGGIEILSPFYSSLRDGNTVTIPAAHRPAGYEPPSFRVRTQASMQETTRR